MLSQPQSLNWSLKKLTLIKWSLVIILTVGLPLAVWAAENRIEAELKPSQCQGWLNADQARRIEVVDSAPAGDFKDDNSAHYRFDPSRSGLGEVAQVDDSLTCAGFEGSLPQGAELEAASVVVSLAGLASDAGEDVIVPSFSLDDGQTWTTAETILVRGIISNGTHDGYWRFPLPSSLESDGLKRLRFRLRYDGVAGPKPTIVYLDGVAVEVSFIKRATEPRSFLKRLFSVSEEPIVLVDEKSLKGIELLDADGHVIDAPFTTEITAAGTKITFQRGALIKPGTYIVRTKSQKFFRTNVEEQSFSFGAASLNVPKSVYEIGDLVDFALGVVDDRGRTVCDARLSLAVEKPNGQRLTLKTSDRSIVGSAECGPESITNQPDYSAQILADQIGHYEATLVVETDRGPEQTSLRFEVPNVIPTAIERLGPTRINPKAQYIQRLRLTPQTEFQGDFIERAPGGFDLAGFSPAATVSREGEEQVIRWAVNWAAGQTYELAYSFDAPDVAPALFRLGPASFGPVTETRLWSISSDEAVRKEKAAVELEPVSVGEDEFTDLKDELVRATKSVYRSDENAHVKVFKRGFTLPEPRIDRRLDRAKALAVKSVEVISPIGTPSGAFRAAETFTRGNKEIEVLHLVPSPEFRPGRYTVQTVLTDGLVDVTETSTFEWGVVAMNVRRSVIEPGAPTEIHLAVLDDFGRTICDSAIELTVTDPNGLAQSFSTVDGSIEPNPDCQDRSVTNDPDYRVSYPTGPAGAYTMAMTATSPDGPRSLTDTFQVAAVIPVTVERTAFPTRIYPIAAYPVTFTITPVNNVSGRVVETLPASFALSDVTAGGTVQPAGDGSLTQSIEWLVDWQAGQTYTLGYTFDAPNVSPLLFRLGPLRIEAADGAPVFTEAREWLIASDATKTWDGGGATASWSEVANWNNDTQPVDNDAIVFDGTSNDNSDWDAGATISTAASLSVTSLSGSLTFTKTPVTVTGDFSHTSTGNVVFAGSAAVTVSGSFTLTTSGTFTANTSTLTMDGTGGKDLNTAKTLYNLTVNPASAATTDVVTNSPTISNTLNVGSNSTLSIGDGLTVTLSCASCSALTLNGTIDDVNNNGKLIYQTSTNFPTTGTMSADLQIDATGGSRTVPGAASPGRTYGGDLEIYSNSSSLRSMTLGSAASQIINVSESLYVNQNSTSTLSASASTNNPTLVVSGDVDYTGVGSGNENIVMGTNSWTVGGNFDIEGSTSTPIIRTLIMNGTGKNLKLNGKTVTTSLQISGTITLTSTDGIIGTSGSLTVDSNKTLTIDSSRTLSVNAISGTTITLNGTINGSGTLSYKSSAAFPTAGAITANLRMDMSSSDQTLSARTSPNGYGGNVEIYCSTVIDPVPNRTITLGTAVSQTIDITGSLSINAAATCNITATAATNDPAVNIGGNMSATGSGGTKTFTVGAGNWKVSGDVTLTGATYTYEAGNTLEMNGTTKTLTSASNSLNNFTVSGGAVAIGDTTDIDNNLTISGGTLTAPTTLTLGGSFDNDAAFTHNSGTITFNAASGTKTIDGDGTGTEAFYNVIFNDSAGSAEFQMTTAVDVDNDLTITGGNFNANSNGLTIGGSFDNDDTFTSGTQTTTFNATTGTKTIDADGTGTEAFSSVTFDDSAGSAIYQLSTAIDIDGNVTITGGNFDANTNAVTVGGNWDNNDTFTTGATQTLTFDATDAGNTIEAGSQTYYAVVFSGAASGNGSWTIQTNDLTVSNSINVNTGDAVSIAVSRILTLGSGATTLTFDGTISGSGTLEYKSNAAFPGGGTLTANVEFDATDNDQTMSARTSGYGASVTVVNTSLTLTRSVTMGAGTIAITGNLNIDASNQDVTLTASSNNPTVTVGGSLVNTGNKLQPGVEFLTMGNGTWTVSGDVDLSSTTVTANSSTLVMNGTGGVALYTDDYTLNNLTIDPTTAATIYSDHTYGDLTVSGTLAIGAGDTFEIGIAGTVTHTGATLTWGDASSTISGTGKLRFMDVSGGPATGGVISATTRFDATTASVASTTFDARTYSGTVELYSGTTPNRSITMASGTYTLSGASSNFHVIMLGASPGVLTIDASANPTVTIGGNLDFTGTQTGSEAITSGTGTWTVSGNVDFSDGTYTATSGNTLTMNGTGGKTIAGNSQSLSNFTIDPSSPATITAQTNDLTVTGTLSVAAGDTLSIASGITVSHSGGTFTFPDTAVVSGAGTLRFTDTSPGPGATGTLSSVVRFDTSSADIASTTFDARTYGGRLELYSNSTTARSVTFAAGSYTTSGSSSHLYVISDGASPGNLTLAGSNNPTVAIGGDLDFTGSGTSSEVITSGTGTWTVSGNVTFTDGTYTASTGNTLVLDGASKTLTSASQSLQHLTLSGSITLANATHTVAGNLSLAGGTITAGSSTVTLTGTANTITGGSQTLNNLTINPASAGTITLQTSNLTVSNTLDVADGDTLSISSGRTVTLSANSGTSLTLNTSGTVSGATGRLTYQNSAATITTAGTISSILRFDSLNGNMTIPSGRSAYGPVELYNNTGTNRQILGQAGTYTLSGAGSYLYLIADGTGNITLDATNGGTVNPTVLIGGDLDFTGSGTSSEVITSGTGTWTVSGNVTFTDGTYTASTGNTLVLDGASKTLTSASQSLQHLTLSGSITLANATHTVAGNLSLAGGTITAGSSTVTLTGTANTITGGSQTLNNLTINPASAGTITLQTSNLTVSNTLDVADGDTLTISSGLTLLLSNTTGTSLTLNTSGTVGGSGRLTYRSSATFPLNGTVNSIVRFDATYSDTYFRTRTYGNDVELMSESSSRDAILTMSAGSPVVSGALSFSTGTRNLTVTAVANDPQLTVSGNLVSAGSGGGVIALALGGAATYVSGNVNLTGITVTDEGGGLLMNGTGGKTLTPGGATLTAFTANPSTPDTIYLAASDSFTLTSQLIVGDNDTFSVGAGSTVTVTGGSDIVITSATITGSGTLVFTNTAGGPGTSGTLSIAVRYDASNGDIASTTLDSRTYGGAVTVTNTGAIDRTATAGAGTFAFSSTLTTSRSGAGTLALDLNTNDPTTTVSGTLTIGSGTTLSANSANALNVNGNYTNNGTFTDNSGTVTLAGSSQQTLSGTLTGSSDFNHLTVTNNSGADPDSSPSVIFSASAATAGTFTAGTASVKIRFTASSTYTFQNIAFNGQASGTRVYLRSSSGGTAWNLNVAGTRDVRYSDVKDSNACGQAPNIQAYDGTNVDSTGNSCWDFDASITFSISDTTIGYGALDSTAARWATGDLAGSGTDSAAAHTMTVATNAGSGYAVTYSGATLTSGANTIDVAAITNDADGTAGTEQFAMGFSTNGDATIATGYDHNATPASRDWTFVASTTTTVLSETVPTATETFSAFYLANISGTTQPGTYTTNITYIATATF